MFHMGHERIRKLSRGSREFNSRSWSREHGPDGGEVAGAVTVSLAWLNLAA